MALIALIVVALITGCGGTTQPHTTTKHVTYADPQCPAVLASIPAKLPTPRNALQVNINPGNKGTVLYSMTGQLNADLLNMMTDSYPLTAFHTEAQDWTQWQTDVTTIRTYCTTK